MRHALLFLALLVLGMARPVMAADVQLPDDSRFTMIVTGAGPDVILLPGLASPRAVWDGAQAALGGRYRLHLAELKGFGGSAAGPNLAGGILDATVRQLADYARANRLARPAVVGHSMGGLLALMLAAQAPDVPGRVMLVDALPFIGMMFGPAMTPEIAAPRAAVMRDQLVASYGRPADPVAAQAAGVFNALTPAAQQQVAAWTMTADPRVTGQALYEVSVRDVRPDLARIAAPVTLVYPWADGRLPRAVADPFYRSAYAALPSVRFVDVGNSGHFVMLDQPDAFAATLKAFLAE